MTRKTEGIVLRVSKHQDTNLIVRVYTADFGMQDFIIKGYASATSRRKYSYFQPLSIVEIVYWEKPGTEIHKITESRSLVFLKEVQVEPVKVALGLAITEIMYDCIKQSQGDRELYEMIQSIIVNLDEAKERFVHFFLYFLTQFANILGFAPDIQVENWGNPVFFDMENGIIRNQAGGNTRLALLIAQFLTTPLSECQKISFTQEEKRIVIATLFQYYHYHIEGFKHPKTIQVFAEIFN